MALLMYTALLLAIGLPAAAACVDDEGCSLNGRCVSGACRCVPEWAGPRCGALNLRPARPRPLSGFDEVGNSSWAGSLMADPSDPGRFHMFASHIAGHCGLNSWNVRPRPHLLAVLMAVLTTLTWH